MSESEHKGFPRAAVVAVTSEEAVAGIERELECWGKRVRTPKKTRINKYDERVTRVTVHYEEINEEGASFWAEGVVDVWLWSDGRHHFDNYTKNTIKNLLEFMEGK